MLDMVIHSEVFGGCANDFDALERVVSSVDSHTSPRQWLYNRRSELVGASGTQAHPYDYAYSYDSIGNRLTSSDDSGTATYAANCLNQYTAVNRTIEQSEQSNNLTSSYSTAFLGIGGLFMGSEHGPTLFSAEPGNRAPDSEARRYLSREITRDELNDLLSQWRQACSCCSLMK